VISSWYFHLECGLAFQENDAVDDGPFTSKDLERMFSRRGLEKRGRIERSQLEGLSVVKLDGYLVGIPSPGELQIPNARFLDHTRLVPAGEQDECTEQCQA